MKKILIAEDNKCVRDNLVSIFKSHGYEVVPAENGAIALSMVKNGLVPDLLITDSEMPEIDGSQLSIEVKKTVKERGLPEILVIMATGNISSVSPNNEIDLIVQKPGMSILVRTVNALLKQQD
ncbi:MAG: response regulator [Candidatus Portnoybacteria bacterium]